MACPRAFLTSRIKKNWRKKDGYIKYLGNTFVCVCVCVCINLDNISLLLRSTSISPRVKVSIRFSLRRVANPRVRRAFQHPLTLMAADYSRGLLLFITYYDNSIVPVPSAAFYDERIARVLPRVLLCKTWRCGLTYVGRAVSTSRRGALSASRALLKALLPLFTPSPSSQLLSRPISLSLSRSISLRGLHPNILYASIKMSFSDFFGDPVYINGIGENGRVARSLPRIREIGSCISEGNQFGSAGLSTCPLNNLRARRYARPACATTTVESTNKISDEVAPRVSDKFLSLVRRRGSTWSDARRGVDPRSM